MFFFFCFFAFLHIFFFFEFFQLFFIVFYFFLFAIFVFHSVKPVFWNAPPLPTRNKNRRILVMESAALLQSIFEVLLYDLCGSMPENVLRKGDTNFHLLALFLVIISFWFQIEIGVMDYQEFPISCSLRKIGDISFSCWLFWFKNEENWHWNWLLFFNTICLNSKIFLCID